MSLDQIRVFVTAADEGSFSAAARKLNRAQSAVSEMVRNLEGQLGLELFDRSGRSPSLTEAGKTLLIDARDVVADIGVLKARARGILAGLEPELSIVFSMLFSMDAVALAALDFRKEFPGVPLRIQVETMGGALQPLLDRRASVGVLGPWPAMPPEIVSEGVGSVGFVTVATPDHPLARIEGTISNAELARHVQLVLTERSELSGGQEFGVASPRTWRLADIASKRIFLLRGLGWGGMPLHVVQEDLDAGRLVALDTEERASVGGGLRMLAAYRADTPPGPAGRWLINRLKTGSTADKRTN